MLAQSSQAELLASLSEKEQAKALSLLTDEESLALLYDWEFWARPKQLIPKGLWATWLILAGRGFGKALALDTPIPTPDGWRSMGGLADGDTVFDEMGHRCRVMKAHPVMIGRKCYRVRFSDGSEIVADEEHLWTTQTRRSRKAAGRSIVPRDLPATVTTKQIAETLYESGEVNHAIPCAGPLDCAEADLPIDPYLLGCWLGDGHSAGAAITTADREIVQAFEAGGFIVTPGRSQNSGAATTYYLSTEGGAERSPTTGRMVSNGVSLHAKLRASGLLHDKKIPAEYLRASVEQRLALLQGLFDTDGYCDPRSGASEFCSTKLELALGARELALSLGLKAVIYTGRATLNGRDCGAKYRVCFTAHSDKPLFRLARKLANQPKRGPQADRAYRRYIVAVEPVASAPVRCITVDSPSHLYLAGEAMIATHNTRTGAEFVRDSVKRGCGHISLMGPTVGDVRAVMVEGESGILACSWQHDFDHKGNWIGRPVYEPSKRRLTWQNGARAYTYSAEEPDSMRGPQSDAGWADEIAAWYDPQAMWDMYQFGLRLGEYPRTCVTTTPRPLPIIRELLAEAKGPNPTTIVTTGNTFENAANVAPKFLATIRKKYAGTRLGRQEINAEVLDDIPGALWTRDVLNKARHGEQGHRLTEFNMPQMVRVVVSVDPSGTKGQPGMTATAKKRADMMANGPNDVGIVVAGLGVDGKGYVLADETCNVGPTDWARIVSDAYHYWSADCIVGETNYGGALVEANIRAHNAMLPYKEVHASRGKSVRAEPVANLYTQDRVKHVAKVTDNFDSLLQLEDQLCLFASDGYKGKGSPDRGDALVWAITELMLDENAYSLNALV